MGGGGAAVAGAFPQLLLLTQRPGIQGGQSLEAQPRSEDQGHLQGDRMDAFTKLLEAHTESSDCHYGQIIPSRKTGKEPGGRSEPAAFVCRQKDGCEKVSLTVYKTETNNKFKLECTYVWATGPQGTASRRSGSWA